MKLTRNLKILLILIISCVMIQLSNSISSAESSKESEKENEEIFSMKHKKIRTATTASSKKSTAQAQTQKAKTATNTNIKAKAKVASTSANTNKNANLNRNTNANKMTNKVATTNKGKQIPGEFTDNTFGANSDLLQQTGLGDVAAEQMGKDAPGHKGKLDFEKMGPIAFKSWIRFFKYTDQAGFRDREARMRFNAGRKFFVNPEFREQLKYFPGEDYKEKDNSGERKYIATAQDFYLVAYKGSVVIFESKIVIKFFLINKLLGRRR